jgi:hypothetical protein
LNPDPPRGPLAGRGDRARDLDGPSVLPWTCGGAAARRGCSPAEPGPNSFGSNRRDPGRTTGRSRTWRGSGPNVGVEPLPLGGAGGNSTPGGGSRIISTEISGFFHPRGDPVAAGSPVSPDSAAEPVPGQRPKPLS